MDKKYYTIGEASRIFGVEQHVLRFWEKEFPLLRPRKTKGGNRRYQKKDLDIIEKIMYLLYEELYTIQGARNKLKKISGVPLSDYKKTEKMLTDEHFIRELQLLLDSL
ncbi:MAG: MerR family transcriptional regulator [Fibrobacterota bacterium]